MTADSTFIILQGMSATSLFLSFLAGVLTFLSPCILPLLPIYLSYISGVSLSQFNDVTYSNAKMHQKVVWQSIYFTCGFSLIFLLIGGTMIKLFSFFFNQPLMSVGTFSLYPYHIAGVIIIILGLHIAQIYNIPFLNYEKRWDFTQNSKNSFSSFLLGISFGLGWSPCIGPVLSSIVLLGSSDRNSGILLLIFYTLGLAIPFVASAFLISSLSRFLSKFKKYMGYVEKAMGILLILMGIIVIFGLTENISTFLLQKYTPLF